jgi:hypothetical protein
MTFIVYDGTKYDGQEPLGILPIMPIVYQDDWPDDVGGQLRSPAGLDRSEFCCLDYEQHHHTLDTLRVTEDGTTQRNEYIDNILSAREGWPMVKFGIWGQPSVRHLLDKSYHYSHWPLTLASGAIFLNAYRARRQHYGPGNLVNAVTTGPEDLDPRLDIPIFTFHQLHYLGEPVDDSSLVPPTLLVQDVKSAHRAGAAGAVLWTHAKDEKFPSRGWRAHVSDVHELFQGYGDD